MPVSPLAGKPAPPDLLIDVARLERDYYERTPDLGDPQPARQLRHQRPPRHVAATAPSPRRTSWPSRRPSASTARRRASTARSIMGKDTHALSGPAQRTALEVLAANGVETDHPARRRRHADAGHLARDPRLQPRPQRRTSPTASSSRRRTTRPRTAASSTTRPTAARPTPTSPSWIQDRANELLRGGQRRREAHAATQRRSRPRRRTQHDFVTPYVDDLRNVIDMDAIRAAGLQARRRSARRRGASTTGSRSARRYGLDIDGREPDGRSDLRVHDRRSRRQDPHGLLQPVRDGQPGRAEGPLRRRLRQRPRRRPARHRHAVGRADEPEPLPGGGDPLPARRTGRDWPATAAVGKTLVSSSMIDRVVASARAASCARCRSASSGSSPGLFDGSLLLRRRGERRRQLPAPRRHRLDHRQGRPRSWTCSPPRSPPRTGKDPGEHYRELTRAVRHAVLHAHRRAGHARAEGALEQALARGGEGDDAGRRADHRQADARARQRRRRSAA